MSDERRTATAGSDNPPHADVSTCEKCWRESQASGDQAARYRQLAKERSCTPEEQAGNYANRCPACDRLTAHELTGVCMVCNRQWTPADETPPPPRATP